MYARRTKNNFIVEVRDPKSQQEMLSKLKEWYGVLELKEEKISARNKERRVINKAKRVAVEEAIDEAMEDEDMASMDIEQIREDRKTRP